MCYGTILSSRIVKSRKQHHCHFCRMPIYSGRHYLRMSFADEGTVGTQKTHVRCMELARQSDAFDFDGCVFELRTHAQEHAKESGWRSLLGRLRIGVKEDHAQQKETDARLKEAWERRNKERSV